jgi:acetoin utilization deacetylase AcuC-like enzyme
MLAIISHPDCLNHDPGPLHPETAERLGAINNQLIMSGLDFVVQHYDAPLVTRVQLERVHDADYLTRVFAMAPTEGYVEIDGDTVMSPGTLKAAQRAAGAGVMGVDLVIDGKAGPVFCAIRPPGHHAERDKAMGFCLFNNIAVAAAHALETHGLSRVAIVDFDVHQGNGTEHIFKSEPRVLFCSIFQHPFYPFTGHGLDTPTLVDVPLKGGTGGPEFRKVVTEHWFPALDRFKPEFLFISAGFDAHWQDGMAGLKLKETDYGWLSTELLKIAKTHCDGRIVSMLEGGYELGPLARSVVAHLNAFLD